MISIIVFASTHASIHSGVANLTPAEKPYKHFIVRPRVGVMMNTAFTGTSDEGTSRIVPPCVLIASFTDDADLPRPLSKKYASAKKRGTRPAAFTDFFSLVDFGARKRHDSRGIARLDVGVFDAGVFATDDMRLPFVLEEGVDDKLDRRPRPGGKIPFFAFSRINLHRPQPPLECRHFEHQRLGSCCLSVLVVGAGWSSADADVCGFGLMKEPGMR